MCPRANLTTALWVDCHRLNISLRAKHLAGIYNVHADRLSQWESPYEWHIHRSLFKYYSILYIYGPHAIHRFASLTTAQLSKYNSLYYDPLAQTDWSREHNFVNAPFFLIPKVLDIVQQQAEATVVTLWWPAQPWFLELRKLAACRPLRLPKSPRTLIRLGPSQSSP